MKFKSLALITVIAFSSFSGFAQTRPKYDEADRLMFKAVELAKHRNEGEVCDFNAYESDVLQNLRLAIKKKPSLLAKIAKDPQINRAMGMNLSYQELIGNIKPGLVGIEKALAKANFESIALGAMGPHSRIQFQVNGQTSEVHVTEDAEGNVSYPESKGSWKILFKSKKEVKVQLNSQTFTLKKVNHWGEEQYILLAPGDEATEMKSESLFNNAQGECEA